MKILDLSVYDYKIPLKKPVYIQGSSLSYREGLILKITNEKDHHLYTEVAPLPFFHNETLQEVKNHLMAIKEKLTHSHWSLKMLLSAEHILPELISPYKMPSLYFGLEMALFSYLMPRLDVFETVKVNALLAGSDQSILENAKRLKGYEAVKLKVGPRSPQETLNLLDKVLPLIPTAKIRIDVNRSWDLKEARFFCDHFDPDFCEYLEEPLENSLELLTLSNDYPHPIAFDESLLDTPLEFLLTIPTKAAFIVKPTLFGAITHINYLSSKARFHNLKFVLTSTFESGLGHLMIAHLAHMLALSDPIGLDTYHFLEKDILSKSLHIDNGTLDLKENNYLNPYLDTDKLIAHANA